MIFKKYDTSTIDKQVEKLTSEFKIHYRACIGSLIYLLSTRVDFIFSVHELAKFLHILRYIRDNNTLWLKYYADMNDAPVSDLLRQSSIKNENQLMDFSDSSWQYFPDTGISTRSYIIFYQVGTIGYGTHVPVLVAQSSA